MSLVMELLLHAGHELHTGQLDEPCQLSTLPTRGLVLMPPELSKGKN